MTATVDNHLAITLVSAQVLIIDSFQPALADDVSRLVLLILEARIFELLRTNLLHVADDVRQHTVVGILTLRRLLDAQRGKLELVRINPHNVGLRGALFD